MCKRYKNETPEEWCSRVHMSLKSSLKKKSGPTAHDYIQMLEEICDDYRKIEYKKTNYIYCTVCDSLVFIPVDGNKDYAYRHLERCINEKEIEKKASDILLLLDQYEYVTCFNKYTERRKIEKTRLESETLKRDEFITVVAVKEHLIWSRKQDILQYEAEIKHYHYLEERTNKEVEKEKFDSVIKDKKCLIWSRKQEIIQYVTEIKCIQLELSPKFKSLTHSEKDKREPVTYYYRMNYRNWCPSYLNKIISEKYDKIIREYSYSIQVTNNSLGDLAEAYFDSIPVKYTRWGDPAEAYFDSVRREEFYRNRSWRKT